VALQRTADSRDLGNPQVLMTEPGSQAMAFVALPLRGGAIIERRKMPSSS
jgi:hypothetical protein